MIDKIYAILNRYSLLITIFIVLVGFFLFYPKTIATIDEHDYLYNAVNIIEGNLRQNCEGGQSQFIVKDYCIFKYNIGASLFYLPLVSLSHRLAFLATIFVFITLIYVFNKVLIYFKISSIWLLLFAFYPPFIYYSRTLLSELYSALLILLSFYLLIKQQKINKNLQMFFLGSICGLAVLVRYSNVVIIMILLAFNLINRLKQKTGIKNIIKDNLLIVLGGFPFLIAFLFLNKYLYGGFFRSGYYYSEEQTKFELLNIFKVGYKYILALTILYPGLSIIPFLARNKYKLAILVVFIGQFIIFTSFSGNNSVFEGRVLDLILGVRFLIPVVPLIMILYFSYLDKFLEKKFIKILIVFVIFLLSLDVFALNFIHQRFLESLLYYWL